MANPVKILLAEDNRINQLVVAGFLELVDCELDIVANGAKAVDAVAANNYDIVLMDLHMPEMDGFDAARGIRGLPVPKRETPIIALTADITPESQETAESVGMNDYVTKPIDQGKLFAAIARLTGAVLPVVVAFRHSRAS